MGTGMDMRATAKTRVQRRVEKKQTLLLVALVLVVSVASFVLGIVVERHGKEPLVVQQASAPQRIIVNDNLVAPVDPVPVVSEPKKDKLSFYDNLSKEEMAPIGSGINLPPEVEKPKVDDVVKVPVFVAQQRDALSAVIPSSTSVSAPPQDAVPVSVAGSGGLPAVVKGGAWVVQVFSSQSAADAGILRDELGEKGYPAFITEADLGKKGIWYRVLFGPYADKVAATQVQAFAEKKDKLKGFVKRR